MSPKRNDGVQERIYDPFRRNPARDRKRLIEQMYLRNLTELACNRFKWDGLPDTIDTRFLELTLFNQALCIFFEHETFGYMALRGSGAGPVNMYDNPTKYKVLGNTMVNKTLSARECVPIWANYLRIPDWDIVVVYASKLAEIDRTIEIDLLAMRTPYAIAASDNEKQTLINAFRQVQEGQPVIFGTEVMGDMIDQKFKLFDLGIDKDIVLNLLIAKAKIWSECMTLLGINNANQDKKERLVADEVSANDSQVAMARNIALNSRQSACAQINERYGLDVSVSWHDQQETLMAGGAFNANVLPDSEPAPTE